MKTKNFAAFILTHGRPDNLVTLKTLESCGYTGKIFIVIDNEDETADRYRELYGDMVVEFDKLAIAKTFDNADNFDDRRAIVYARNATFEIAKDLGIDYFVQLDDDYDGFIYRFNDRDEYKPKKITGLDNVFDAFVDFLKSTPIASVAMAQGGDFIGGGDSAFAKTIRLKRKAMNSFFCATDRPFQFVGRINEDVNTYTYKTSIGQIFLTAPNVSLNQKQTQASDGGMTDIYLDNGTYVKSFYSIIFQPSSVKISLMGRYDMRIHHSINWRNTAPKLLNPKFKK